MQTGLLIFGIVRAGLEALQRCGARGVTAALCVIDEHRGHGELGLFVSPGARQMHARVLVIGVFIERPEDRRGRGSRWRGLCLVDEDGAGDAVLAPRAAKDTLQLSGGYHEDLAAARTSPVDGQELGHRVS